MKKDLFERIPDQRLRAVRQGYKAIVEVLDNAQSSIKNSLLPDGMKSTLEKFAKISSKNSPIMMSSVLQYIGKWKDSLQAYGPMKFKNVDGTQSMVEMMIAKPDIFSHQEEKDLQVIEGSEMTLGDVRIEEF